jgi:hypothetical protein
MSQPSVKLTPQELDRALSYIEATRASDFFPQPFEFQAIRHSWKKIRPALERVELLSYSPNPAIEFIAPKQRALVRPVHLLNPLDTIFFTGLVFKVVPTATRKRNEYQNGKVFSWHYVLDAIDPTNPFQSDWDGFREKAEELSKGCEFVATADIVDFFPRVYLHRLENALKAISGDTYLTRAIMNLIGGWADGTSYGIPTGPHASNFLAEILLIEVDQYLISCGIEFIRWVDDYVIFGNSESDCQAGMFQLGTRLQQTQGLSLNPAKSRIYPAMEYRSQVWHKDDPTSNLRDKIIDEVFDGNPYADVNYEDLSPEDKKVIDELDVKNSLEKALSGDLIDLAATKFLLKVLTALRRPELIDPVLSSLDRLLPVVDSVGRFFDTLDKDEETNHQDIGKRLIAYLQEKPFCPDFQTMWLLDPFTRSSSWNNLNELRVYARNNRNMMVRRQAILGLGQIGDRSALLDVRYELQNTKDWERNAIIYACRALPLDELNALISSMKSLGGDWKESNALQKAVIEFVKKSS